MATEPLGGSRWNFAYLRGIICPTFREKKELTGSCQVTELWRHNRNEVRPTFQGNRAFSNGTCYHWLEWRHYAWFRLPDDYTSDLWHCILTFRRSSEVTDLGWPHALVVDIYTIADLTPIVIKLAGFGVSWGPGTEHVGNFLHRHVYSASLQYPMSIKAIDSVCPLAMGWRCSLPGHYLCVTNMRP